MKTKDNGISVVDVASKIKTNNSASDCTSSTECNSEGDSDRNSDNVYNVKAAAGAASGQGVVGANSLSIPTPAPRTTLEKSLTKSSLQSSIRSMSVDRVKQVRHESLV